MKKKILLSIMVVAIIVCGGYFYLQNQKDKQSRYDLAMVAINNQEYETAIDLLAELGTYKDSNDLYKKTFNSYYYSQAKEKMAKKDYEQAFELFDKVSGYEDADKLKQECEEKKVYQGYAKAKVGESITFAGRKYIVLDNTGTKLLIRSDDYIESRAYEPSATISSWSTSELREYLNGTYLTDNFSENERKIICPTNLTTNNVNTTDKIFIFSLAEAKEYGLIKKLTYDDWWLRDVANSSTKMSTAMYVNEYGELVRTGMYTNLRARVIIGMWIDYSSID